MTACRLIAVIGILFLLCGCASGIINKAKNGDVAGVKQSLANGANIETVTEMKNTPIMVAAVEGHADVVELLCSRGANVNARNIHGATALIYATYYDRENSVRALLKCGADKEIRDMFGNRAIDYAKGYGFTSIVEILK